MNDSRVFLSAEWKNLLLLNYKVADSVLFPYLPEGCELDRYQGSAYVSVVAFQFLNTKVLGVKWPGYVNFPELNLRFYVKSHGQRGVCFIREYVPSRLVSFIARSLFNEPYQSAKLKGLVTSSAESITANYVLSDDPRKFSIQVTGSQKSIMPTSASLEHFFKEHELGVGKDRTGKTTHYQVWHPAWDIYPVESAQISIDWSALYGNTFAHLKDQKPDSICFAKGSEIRVKFLQRGRT